MRILGSQKSIFDFLLKVGYGFLVINRVRETVCSLKRTNSLSDSINDQEAVSNFQQEVKYRLLTPEDSHEFNSRVNVLKLDMKMHDSSSVDISDLEKDSIAH